MVPWFAAYSMPQKEAAATEYLVSCGIEAFCPTVEEVRRRKRRATRASFDLRRVEVPAFPRYLFVDAVVAAYDACRRSPESVGRLELVGTASGALAIPDSIVRPLQLLKEFTGDRGVDVGTKLVLDFPLQDVEGVVASLERLKAHRELRVYIEMLGSRRLVSVPLTAVRGIA